MDRNRMICMLTLLGCFCASVAWGVEFKLSNGNIIRGEIASADEDGLVVRLDIGGYSMREPWINFTQDTLRFLRQNPDAREFVDPFIEPTPEELQRNRQRRQVTVRNEPPRLERPAEPPGLIAGLTSPIGILILVLLAAANLYAAYEVALFREQPPALVCGLALVLPVIGQMVFLAMPTRAPAAPAPAEATAEIAAAARKTTSIVSEKPAGLSLAAAQKTGPASATAQPQVYARGDHTFNRRFFETKFPGFFRVVPSEAEKDLVMVIRGVKNEYVGRRISRISSNELHLQLLSGNNEVSVQFAEIHTVIIRHKDAKA